MLSRLPISMLAGKIAIDVGQVGTSLVIKYSDQSLQYFHLDQLVAQLSGKPDFYFELRHRAGVIERGKTIQDTITLKPVKGYKETVKFTAVDVPPGFFVTFTPQETHDLTKMEVKCDLTAKLGQTVLQIRAKDKSGLTRTFDLVLTVANPGSGFGLNSLPSEPVDGQNAITPQEFINPGTGQVTPAGTTMMFMSHTGWTPNPTYKGNVGDWEDVKENSASGFSIAQHSYTRLARQSASRAKVFDNTDSLAKTRAKRKRKAF